MKEIAIIILLIVISPILAQPFLEMNLIIIDKAKVDSAIRISGRLAISSSVSDENRANVKNSIDKLAFVKRFSDSFERALNLERVGTLNEEFVEFRALDDKFNDLKVIFNWIEDINHDLDGNIYTKNICEVNLESPYKFKTKYLKVAEESMSDVSDFKLTSNKTFVIKIEN